MATKKRCVCCGKYFELSPYNKHHQDYCTAPECQRARKRMNKRNSRKRLLGGMTPEQLKAFRLHECRRINRIRHTQRSPAPARPISAESNFLNNAFKGLVAQLTGTTDHETLRLQITKFAEFGRAYSAGGG